MLESQEFFHVKIDLIKKTGWRMFDPALRQHVQVEHFRAVLFLIPVEIIDL
jgi:hypothetical protein